MNMPMRYASAAPANTPVMGPITIAVTIATSNGSASTQQQRPDHRRISDRTGALQQHVAQERNRLHDRDTEHVHEQHECRGPGAGAEPDDRHHRERADGEREAPQDRDRRRRVPVGSGWRRDPLGGGGSTALRSRRELEDVTSPVALGFGVVDPFRLERHRDFERVDRLLNLAPRRSGAARRGRRPDAEWRASGACPSACRARASRPCRRPAPGSWRGARRPAPSSTWLRARVRRSCVGSRVGPPTPVERFVTAQHQLDAEQPLDALARRDTEPAPPRVGREHPPARLGHRARIAGGTRYPVSATASGTPPTDVATTGTPHDIDSSTE